MWGRIFLFLAFLTLCNSGNCQTWKLSYDSASFYWKQGSPELVLDHLRQAEVLARNDLGVYDPNYLVIINDLGLAYLRLSQHEQARKYLQMSVSLRQEIDATDDTDYITACKNYTDLLLLINPFEALKFNYNLLKKNPGSPSVLFRLGQIYESTGNLDSARYFYFKPVTATSTDFARQIKKVEILRLLSRYDEALKLVQEFRLNITQNPSSEEVTLFNSQLCLQEGMTYSAKGEFMLAEKTLLKAKDMDVLAFTNPQIVNALAELYSKIGLPDKSVKIINEGLRESNPDGNQYLKLERSKAALFVQLHQTDSAWNIYNRHLQLPLTPVERIRLNMNASRVLEELENYEMADTLLKNALEIADLFKMNESVKLELIIQIGYHALRQSDFKRADSLLSLGLEKKELQFGHEAPVLYNLKNSIAISRLACGEIQNGMDLMAESIRNLQQYLRLTFPSLSRTEQIQLYHDLGNQFDQFNSLVVSSANTDQKWINLMFEKQLLLKGLMLHTPDATLSGCNDLTKVNHLTATREKLVSIYNSPENANKAYVKQLEDSILLFEHQLALECPGTGNFSYQTDWTEVSMALNPGEVLIDFLRVRDFSTRQTDSTGFSIGFTAGYSYVAILLKAGQPPQLIKFPDGEKMENGFYNYYRNSIYFNIPDPLSYAHYWKPLEKYLAGSKVVFVVKDGVYHKINLNNLRISENEYLINKYEIRQLVNPGIILTKQTKASPGNAVVFGDPNPATISTGEGEFKLNALPGTREEVKSISQFLSTSNYTVRQFTGDNATITNLKNQQTINLLHIATHGFFSPSLIPENSKIADAGLMASGLIFSNDTLTNKNVLSAYELQSMNFSQTQLVVLSACESGLGQIRNGEGIDGLQRAFLGGGAKNVILSLWRVEDMATNMLMTKFYKRYLEKSNPVDALRQSQIEMINNGYSPKEWSAFILVGR